MITLDGSYGEGGGALVRTALALSTLTGKEFKVNNIRAGRKKPGLKAQHLTAIKALKQISDAQTNEIAMGSTELWFKPGVATKGIYEIDIGTAGSISLLLQALILPCMFAPGKVRLNIKGGTCGKWQASVDYIQNVLLPQVQRFVEKIELKILKRGYYPKGGGSVSLEINPRFKLKNHQTFTELLEELRVLSQIRLERQGQLEQIRGIVNASSELMSKEVGERIIKSARNDLSSLNAPVNIRLEYVNTKNIGGEIVLWSVHSESGKVDYENPIVLGSDALIEKGKSSEQVGKEAAEKLKKAIRSNAAADSHLTDQLIQFMGILPGSMINAENVTDHTYTNIYVAEKFLPVSYKVEGKIISSKKI